MENNTNTFLESLEQKRGELKKELSKLNSEIKKERLRIIKEIHGVSIDSIVKSRDKEYKVTYIDTGWWTIRGSKPWLRGVIKRKDGTWGTRIFHLYSDWTVIKT